MNHETMPEKPAMGLVPLLIAAAVILGGFFLLKDCCGVSGAAVDTAPKILETVKTAPAAVATAANSILAALGEFFKRKLPNGVELNIPQLGIENKLVGFIEDATKPADKTTWFDFDRLLFDTGKATLQPSSQEQLTNIAEILKAYPKIKVKIGGYTDNTGDPGFNLKLSNDRAINVMAELVKLGIPAVRMTAEGYGDQFPVGDNATEEGRAKNRRISLRVTEK
ncbi:MAG: OmpA family protein [Acidobacteriota bacterium]